MKYIGILNCKNREFAALFLAEATQEFINRYDLQGIWTDTDHSRVHWLDKDKNTDKYFFLNEAEGKHHSHIVVGTSREAVVKEFFNTKEEK